MTRSRSARAGWLLVLAVMATACGTASERSAGVDPTPAGAADDPALPSAETFDPAADDQTHADHPDHPDRVGHGDHGDHEVAASTRPATTRATLAALAAMDPDRLRGLHDHDGHGRQVAHPNGVDPERIGIPSIEVDADVIDLGLQDDGSMEVPSDFAQTGWFAPGPRPGRVGPAVIAGHVDSRRGPAVFHRLTELSRGDRIEVHGADGEIVTFAVRDVEQHPKDAFPTDRVYQGTPGPELRLITCGGDFDHGERSYRDNVIVYAERVEP